MPELPEVEITVRRIGAAVAGAEVESVLAPGMVTMKSVEPPLSALRGMTLARARRIGKMPVLEFEEPRGERPAEAPSGGLALLIHLMSAGRLRLADKRASLNDRRSRLLIRLADGRELRLREYGTRQRAWAKLLRPGALDEEEMVATLGPEAWPAPTLRELAAIVAQPRHLHPLLRDQRAIAGIGRSWVDEILWRARLSPFKRGAELDSAEVERLYDGLAVLGEAIDHYEQALGEDLPEKLPMPLRVHKREGEPCPRCTTTIEAVYFAEHQTNYCPACQTAGRVLKDRRLSRLLK